MSKLSETKNQDTVTYGELFKFFLPLALNPMMIGSTHTIINAALARLPAPELSIAVFTVVKSLGNIIRAPIIMSRQAVTSLAGERKGYYLTRKFLWSMCTFIFLILFMLGYTSLGGWVLRNIIGLQGKKQIAFAYLGLQITCFLPFVELLRNFYQGLAIGLKKTKLVIPGIILRLIIISVFLWWAVRFQVILGIVAGSVAWVIGIGIEGLFMLFYIKNYYDSPVQASDRMPSDQKGLNLLGIMKFFLPLGVMMILNNLLQPIIQSGIARSFSPTQSLAAYGIAWTLIMIVAGPLRMINQCSLVYSKGFNSPGWKTILNFCLLIGLAISLLIFIIAITPIGYWILRDLIAVSEEITWIVRQTMVAFSIFPLVRAFKEAHWGVLMKQQTTSAIGVAKVINIIVVSFVLILVFGVVTIKILEPAVVGALAFSVGEGAESLIIRNYCMNNKKDERESGVKRG